jgi:outer membrane protein TolC
MRKIVFCALLLTASAHAATRTLTLEQAVDLAMKVDPLVAEARVNENRSKNAVLRAQLDRFSFKVDGALQELWNKANIGGPTIPALCSVFGVTTTLDPMACAQAGGTSIVPDQSPESGQGLFNLSANLTVPVFSGLRVESNVSMRQRMRDAAMVNIRQLRKDTALAVVRAYWNARRIANSRDMTASTIERLKDAESVTEARLRAGLAPPIDKNRATARRLTQEALLADYQGLYHEATVQLAVMLNINEDLELVDNVMPPEGVPPPVDALLDDAHRGRPEIAIARLNAEAQHYAVRIARSNFFPQLAIFGLFQYGNNPFLVGSGARATSDATNPFANLSGNLQLGASLSMNFFDTLNTWTGMRDALYEEDRLNLERQRLARVVDSDVRVAHAKVLHYLTRRAPLQAARDVARDNLSILEARYKNGDALVIEYLDAANELSQAEIQLGDDLAQLYMAWTELSASLGKIVGAQP